MQKTINLSKIILVLIIIVGLAINGPQLIEFISIRANPIWLLGSLVPLVFLPTLALFLISGKRATRLSPQARLYIVGAYFLTFFAYLALLYAFLLAFAP
jgi:hypothetical protein